MFRLNTILQNLFCLADYYYIAAKFEIAGFGETQENKMVLVRCWI